ENVRLAGIEVTMVVRFDDGIITETEISLNEQQYAMLRAEPILTQKDEKEILFELYIYEVWNEGNLEVLDNLLTEDHQFTYVGSSENQSSSVGIEETATRILDLRNFGTKFEFKLEDILLGDDRLWARLTWDMGSFIREG